MKETRKSTIKNRDYWAVIAAHMPARRSTPKKGKGSYNRAREKRNISLDY